MKKIVGLFCVLGLCLLAIMKFSTTGNFRARQRAQLNRISSPISLDMRQLRGLEVSSLPSVLQMADRPARLFVDGVLADGSRTSLIKGTTGTTYTVSGGNREAISVDQDGVVTPRSPGIAEITVRNGKHSQTTIIEVFGMNIVNRPQQVSNGQGVTYTLMLSRDVRGFFTINTASETGEARIVRSEIMLKELFKQTHVGRMRVPLLGSGKMDVSAIGSYPMTALDFFVKFLAFGVKMRVKSCAPWLPMDPEKAFTEKMGFFTTEKSIPVAPGNFTRIVRGIVP